MKQLAPTNIDRLSRRDFLKVAGGLGLPAASLSLLEACAVNPATQISEDVPLETTTIRLTATPSVCFAPQYLAEDTLKTEGFTDIQYYKTDTFTIEKALSSGLADISMSLVPATVVRMDAADP